MARQKLATTQIPDIIRCLRRWAIFTMGQQSRVASALRYDFNNSNKNVTDLNYLDLVYAFLIVRQKHATK